VKGVLLGKIMTHRMFRQLRRTGAPLAIRVVSRGILQREERRETTGS
jgi:hypothetical protein